AGSIGHLGIEGGKLVRALGEAEGPLLEETGAAGDELGGAGEAAIDRLGSDGARRAAPADPLDLELRALFRGAIEERLAHDQRARLRRHRQPVARPRLAADRNLEASVGLELDLRVVEITARRERPGSAVIPFLGAESEIMHRPAFAADSIFVFPAYRRVLII